MRLAARLLYLGRVKESGDYRRGADPYRYAGPYQLGPALLVRPIGIVVAVVHRQFSMAFGGGWEAA